MKKKLTGIIAFCVIAAVIAASVGVGIWAVVTKKPTFKMAILSDLHVFAEPQVGDPNSEAYRDFDSNGRYLLFSEALLKSAVDELLASDCEVLLVSGDLTESGTKASHIAVARELKRLAATGKKVFVIPGNHDINTGADTYENGIEEPTENVSPGEFAEIYAECGYNAALARDEKTLSYTADLNGEYRLIAIDAQRHEDGDTDGPALDDRLMAWIEEQLDACKADGRKPIGMMHYPLLDHLGAMLGGMGMDDLKVNNSKALSDLLISGGMKYIFTGHLHAQNIELYQNGTGEIYDVETGALGAYPSPMRFFTSYKKEEAITSAVLRKIDEKNLPSYITSEMKAEMQKDLQGFLADYFDAAMTRAILKNVDTDIFLTILDMLGLDEDSPEVIALAEELKGIVEGFLNMKIYDKSAAKGERTLESIVRSYCLTLPESGYETILEFVFARLRANFAGDEAAAKGSAENIIFKYGIFSVFHLLYAENVFGKLHALDPTIANIDLADTVETLFETGGLELVENALIQKVISSLKFIKDTSLSVFSGVNSAAAVKLLEGMFKTETIGFKNFKITLSAPFPQYIEKVYDNNKTVVSAKLMLGKFIDNELFGGLTQNLLNDKAPADNTLRVKK